MGPYRYDNFKKFVRENMLAYFAGKSDGEKGFLNTDTRLTTQVFKNNIKNNQTSQYEIGDAKVSTSADGAKFYCIINLRRMYMYHVTNTYFPTLTLLIISELTLFFDGRNLQVSWLSKFFIYLLC